MIKRYKKWALKIALHAASVEYLVEFWLFDVQWQILQSCLGKKMNASSVDLILFQ